MPNGTQSSRPADPRLSDLAQRVAIAVLVSVVILALSYLAWRGAHVLLEAFAGILLAVFLSSLSQWLSDRAGIRHGWALTIVVVMLFSLFAGVGWFLANSLAAQIVDLSQTLPQSLERIQEYILSYPWGEQLLKEVPFTADSIGKSMAVDGIGSIVSWGTALAETTLVILLIGIFGAAEPEMYRAGLLHLVPRLHRPRVNEALDAVVFNLRWWLVGQVLLMVLIGVTTWLGLWLLGVKLALALGVIAGLLEMVPYVGAWMAAVPAALIAMLGGPEMLAATLGLYLFLHILEGYVLVPLIQQKAVLMPPVLTLVGQILLGELLGLMGLFVAAPLTAAIVVLVKMLYVEDTLGDEAVDVPGEPGNDQKLPAKERREQRSA